MTPNIILVYTYGIVTVIFLIVAVIRLIVRLSSGSNNSKPTTNYNSGYKPPMPNQQGQNPVPPGANPYQQNPGTNPYQQNPANPYQQGAANPYTQNPANPYNPTAPPPIPGSDPQQNYVKPTFQQNAPGTSVPPRSTSIPGNTYQSPASPYQAPGTYQNPNTNYPPYTPDQPKKSRTGLIVGIIIGAVVIIGGLFAWTIAKHVRDAAAADAWGWPEFKLAYDNPSEHAYTLILDDWDTIAIKPYSMTDDLDYRIKREQTKFHWKIIDDSKNVVIDTNVSMTDIDLTWSSSDWGGYSNSDRTILFNPSKATFVEWTVWFGDDNEEEELVDVEVGDSTYEIDGFTMNDIVIFDTREHYYINDIASARGFSDQTHQVYLVSERDFHPLYQVVYGHTESHTHYNEFRNLLIELHSDCYDKLSAASNPTDTEIDRVNRLDELIPDPISTSTTVDEFEPVINFLRVNDDFFADLAPTAYYEVKADMDDVMNDIPDASELVRFHFQHMALLSYSVMSPYEEGKMPSRSIDSEHDRGEDGKPLYQ